MPTFTPDSELDLLFSPELIPSEVKAQLGSDLHVRSSIFPQRQVFTSRKQIRPLARNDHTRSHLSVLSVLTSTPPVSPIDYTTAFDTLRSCPNTYFTLVIINKSTDQIVGVGCVFVEQKFIRGLGKVGHIEDIAVDKNTQGRKLGLRIINALTAISEAIGCYKTILNCNNSNIREVFFYVAFCGYVLIFVGVQLSTKSAASRKGSVKWLYIIKKLRLLLHRVLPLSVLLSRQTNDPSRRDSELCLDQIFNHQG